LDSLNITYDKNTKEQARKELKQQIMLNVNKSLFEKGHITEQMYNSAKQSILSM